MNRKTMWVAAAAIVGGVAFGSVHSLAVYAGDKDSGLVLEKLDITSLPSAYRPKKEKGKKTFADYGYTIENRADSNLAIKTPDGAQSLSMRILDDRGTEAYACIAESATNGGDPKVQSVIRLRKKGADALWKARESSKEFASCPEIGENEPEANSYGG